jgi:L-threonylcarbamoyladenylate synthase
MQTISFNVAVDAPDPALIEQAATVLRKGGLVAFPTETVYGLGANALHTAAVARIFQAKGRPANNPIIVHVGETKAVFSVVSEWTESAARLADRFWPGPLTLVLPKRSEIPDIVTAGSPTVAVRMPAHPVALALLRTVGVPIAAPSANRSAQLSPTRAEHVLADLGGQVDLILDAGPTSVGLESTVVDLTTSPPRVLRPGHVTPSMLEEVIGCVARGAAAVSAGQSLPSPGLLPRHYAPHTPLLCVEGDATEQVAKRRHEGKHVGWLRLGRTPVDLPGSCCVVMPSEPAGYAARLYAELHVVDSAGLDVIIVEMPPQEEEWLAVRDRLRRASVQ